jgi:hypothetical protein
MSDKIYVVYYDALNNEETNRVPEDKRGLVFEADTVASLNFRDISASIQTEASGSSDIFVGVKIRTLPTNKYVFSTFPANKSFFFDQISSNLPQGEFAVYHVLDEKPLAGGKGPKKCKKTAQKVKVGNVARVVYEGPRGGKYVKVKGVMVSLKKLKL